LQERIPRLAQGKTFFLVHVVRMELNLNCFFDDAFQASRYMARILAGVFKLDVVIQVYAVLSLGNLPFLDTDI
jgi:hypothetical protein